MVDFASQTVIASCASLAGVLVVFAEKMHATRVALSVPLAFGPTHSLAAWIKILPALRGVLMGAAVWALMTLIAMDGAKAAARSNEERHLVVLLDVSPSMLIEDASPARNQRRALRAAEVLESVLNRAPGDHLKVWLSAFYTTQKPLIQESVDRNLILYMARDLPLHIAFKTGKTNLLDAVNKTAAQCAHLRRGSTTLLVLSDGDTVSDTGLAPLPPAIHKVIIAGIGDTAKGEFIDSHVSRQDTASLSQLARRLHGRFYDANTRHIPSDSLTSLMASTSPKNFTGIDTKTVAIAIITCVALMQAGIPFLLQWFGAPPHPAHASSNARTLQTP
jgi:Ca-activated chloride channel family protein